MGGSRTALGCRESGLGSCGFKDMTRSIIFLLTVLFGSFGGSFSHFAAAGARHLWRSHHLYIGSAFGLVILLHSLTAGAGPSLREALQRAAAAAVDPARSLIKDMFKPDAHKAVMASVEVMHGEGALDDCERMPLDNKTAIFKNVMTVLISIKDALREMSELEASPSFALDVVEESDEGTDPIPQGQPHSASDGDEGDEDVTDFEPGQLSGVERRTLEAARKLSEAAGKVLRSVSKPLLQGPKVTPDTGLDGWEIVLWHARALQRSSEDLGTAMYPPQEIEEVQVAAEGMYNTARLLLQEIPEPYAEQLAVEAALLEQQLEGS